jgi:enterochelin esterase-like enzyme
MRWLVICLVACGSNVRTPEPAPPRSPPPAAAAPVARPSAEPFDATKVVTREIDASQIHRYRVTLAANMVISGVANQDGIDLEVVTYDATGAKLRTFDSPNGEHGPEPFVIQGTAAGDYDFEVRRVEIPPGEPVGNLSSRGHYHLSIEVVSADDYAYQRAKEIIVSPRILAVWRDVQRHQMGATDKLWAELAGKGPIVEPYADHPDAALVTFVMRSKSPYVGAVLMDFHEKPMSRIGDSDLWYATVRVPADSSFDYGFIVADGPPPVTVPWRPGGGDGRLDRVQRDPNNPKQHFILSRIELPGAPPQPWIVANPNTPKGVTKELTIDSKRLGEKRKVGVYVPPGYDPKQRYPLLIAFDGEVYGMGPEANVPLPTILDNLIAAKKIPPIVAALVATGTERRRDLAYSEPFGNFVADELVPKLRAEFHAGYRPQDVVITGSSLGGLASSFIAFHHSDVIGKVLSQSGSYQWIANAVDHDLDPTTEGNQLARDIAAAPKKPITFYLETGIFEDKLRDGNRHLRDVLVAKGYALTYREFHGSHDYSMWRGTISDGLIALLSRS